MKSMQNCNTLSYTILNFIRNYPGCKRREIYDAFSLSDIESVKCILIVLEQVALIIEEFKDLESRGFFITKATEAYFRVVDGY
jgi:hypothetical protein